MRETEFVVKVGTWGNLPSAPRRILSRRTPRCVKKTLDKYHSSIKSRRSYGASSSITCGMLIFPLGALHNQLGLLNCVHLIDWVEEVDPGSEDVHDVSGGSTMMKSLLSVAAVWGLSAMVWAADPPAGSPATAPSPKPAATAPAAPTVPTVVTTTTPARRFGLLARIRERRAMRVVYTAPVTTTPSTTPSTTVPMPMPKPADGSSSTNSTKVVPASGSTTTPSTEAGTTVVTMERVVPMRRMGLLQRLRLRR